MCGYCERPLVLRAAYGRRDRWECPRCAPILATLGAGMDLGEMVRAFRTFQREAARSYTKRERANADR